MQRGLKVMYLLIMLAKTIPLTFYNRCAFEFSFDPMPDNEISSIILP